MPASETDRLRDVVRGVRRLRDATLPWAAMAGIVAAVTAAGLQIEMSHDLTWSLSPSDTRAAPRLGFGGRWYVWVARPVFLALLVAWLWRFVLRALLLRGIARLPTHPDRVAGLGFLDRLAVLGAPVALAVSAVFCAYGAHRTVVHGEPLQALAAPALVLLLVMLVAFPGPFLAFVPPLAAARRRAELEYGTLVGEHGRRVRQQWILGRPLADRSMLEAPELGPIADTAAVYESVLRLRTIPIGRRALAPIAIAIAAAVPALALVATQGRSATCSCNC